MSRFENIQMNSIEIYNVMGEKIYSTIINLDAPNGIYFPQLKTEQGIANKKIMINK